MTIKFKQAIQVTHENVRQIMELPCIESCHKRSDGSFEYLAKFSFGCAFRHLYEGEWIVEFKNFKNHVWDKYTATEWDELNKQ